jgi:O-antigen biosynthesis protein WbqP
MVPNSVIRRNVKRLLDLILVFLVAMIFFMPMIFIFFIIKKTSGGEALHWSVRVGRDNMEFHMPKYRTMREDTPELATDLLKNPEIYITGFGSFLRKTSLDELPQIWSVLIGDMSFVGPRPALFNQKNLILLRNQSGVDKLLPGSTGWAQINGRDDLPIELKVVYDEEYLNKQSIWLDLKIIGLTIIRVLGRHGVSH